MIMMTKRDALYIQDAQISWYANIWGLPIEEVRSKVAAVTTADALEDGVEYNMVTINRNIPRGGAIERMFGRDQRGD